MEKPNKNKSAHEQGTAHLAEIVADQGNRLARRDIAVGLDQIARGEARPFNLEKIKKEVLEQLDRT